MNVTDTYTLFTSKCHVVPSQFLVVTQHSSLVTTVNEEERCVTIKVTSAKETTIKDIIINATTENFP